jgi:exopolyphosphatase/guanosine-5'-triphosphate,3'-diphosphate pyrophosphatase
LEQFAAIDLGSNSFHMKVAHAEEHGITVIDRERDMVRLAAGLDASGLLTPEASERALGCLARFGERLRGLKPDNVRIVGTNALRKAKNSREFIAKAEQALGFSIEIISGIEEARLVYLGAAQSLQGDRGRRLVVDIGGGSTEIIVADKSDPVFLSSEKFFPNGEINRLRMRRAILSAHLELEPHIAALKALSAKDIIGTSGTARAINNVIMENGWSDTGITRKGLKKLVKKIVKAGHSDNLKLSGLSEERRPVFAGGVAVMMGIFKALDLEFMRVSVVTRGRVARSDRSRAVRGSSRRHRAGVDEAASHRHGTRQARPPDHTYPVRPGQAEGTAAARTSTARLGRAAARDRTDDRA